MAARGPVQDLCDELTCAICLEDFTDPVTIAECGHNFCRACLAQSWGDAPVVSCPNCRKTARRKSLIPNRQLENVVEIAKKLSHQGEMEARCEERVCEKHQEPLKLFCKDHQAPICLVCDKSKEHDSHKVVPQEEAFQEYKDQICSRLKILREEREKILTYKADAEEESRDLLNQTEEERQKTKAEFRQMHQFLEEWEKNLLNQIQDMEKEIARRRDEHLARLCRELSSLENVIQEMEEKCLQPASEFLQDVRRTLQRSEKKEAFENPAAFPPELLCRIREFYDVILLVEHVMEQFPAKVTLDPDTAQPKLVLSEDRKSVRRGKERQVLPDNPERFDYWPCVLGCEGFTAGRHFWEVTVGSEDNWAVGVARKSVKRKGKFPLGPEKGVWAVGKLRGQYGVVNTHNSRIHKLLNSLNSPLLFLSQELRRIRVTLNYAEGQVAFSDANTGVHLYTHSGASFCGETVLPFFFVYKEAHLRLSP